MLKHSLVCFLIVFQIWSGGTFSVSAEEGIGDDDLRDIVSDASKLAFENESLRQAYTALQAWKLAIFSDPFNFTVNWKGSDVCSYNGVFCSPSPANVSRRVVAGIDLNGADIAGFLPPEIGKLTDLALLHLNSNRFCGVVPTTIRNLRALFELDLSNNRFKMIRPL